MLKKMRNAVIYNIFPTKIKPSSFTAVLTGRCNLRCQTCNFWKSKIPEMSTDKWKDIIKQFSDFGIEHASFTGGEPLLRKDVFELAAYAKDHGISLVLASNGVLIDKFIDKLDDFDAFGISLDSLTKHDKIRGVPGTFDKVVKNIKLLVKNGKKVGIRTVVQSDNYTELEKIADFCEELGVHSLEFLYVRETDNQYVAPQDKSVFKMDVEILKDTLKRVCKRKIVTNTYDYFDLSIRRTMGPVKYPCLRPYEGVMVHPDGKIFPCCGELPSVGDITKSTFKEIWPTYSEVRKKAFKCEFPQCMVCTSPNIQKNYDIKKFLKKRVLKT